MILSPQEFPNTEEGSNWTVVVFRCPRRNWTETLRNLCSELDNQGLSLMPHYTIRAFDPLTDSFMISFRILRQKIHEVAITSLLEKILKNYEHEIDPKGSSPFSQFHAWGSTVGWTKDRCEILSKMSRFALESIKANTSMEVRLDWAHLFSNMIAIFDYEKRYRSPEIFPEIYLLKYH
jgi:hypothetical protein